MKVVVVVVFVFVCAVLSGGLVVFVGDVFVSSSWCRELLLQLLLVLFVSAADVESFDVDDVVDDADDDEDGWMIVCDDVGRFFWWFLLVLSTTSFSRVSSEAKILLI